MGTLPTQEETPLKEKKKEKKVFDSEDMMQDYHESHIPMLGISLWRKEHRTIHQKEFRRRAEFSGEENESLKGYHESRVPVLGISLAQRKHKSVRHTALGNLNWKTKKIATETREVEGA